MYSLFTFRVKLLGDRFEKENGCREFFDKDYKVFGEAFILVKKNYLGSYQLIKMIKL